MGLQERRARLRQAIDALPRVKLTNLPTPLHEAPRLSGLLGGPHILIKRDDLTELPLTGNKARMFEFSLARALEMGADTVVQSSSVQSNYCRQLALACAKLGLQAHLVLYKIRGDRDLEVQGNLLLTLLAGAHVEIVDEDISEQPRLLQEKVEELQRQGRVVYATRATETDEALEAAAYAECALELYDQLQEMGTHADHIFVSAYDTTQAGLLVGTRYLGLDWQIVGISPFRRDSRALTAKIANHLADLLDLDVHIEADEVINTSEYAGAGYGVASLEGLDAIQLVARAEGIILDPVYTGKTMAALQDYIRRGRISRGETVVFLHTGGFPLVFAYHDDIAASLPNLKGVYLNAGERS